MEETEVQQKPVFLTQNHAMRSLVGMIKQVARIGCKTFLITGENGTGKEVFAKMFQYYSKRQNKPMITVNCGAIPSQLVESELFGHEKGAFTGAHEQKKGSFELADGGILFLDEIGEMPKSIQVKLLRAVELGTFRRVGGSKEIKVDITLISATNKILVDQVKAGSFREDLFYRINVIELYIPPLRHRKEDIPLLVNYYKEYFANLYNRDELEFSDECIATFMAYDWPGNVRELKNVVERCVVLSEGGGIEIDSILPRICKNKDSHSVKAGGVFTNGNTIPIPIGTTLEEVEKKIIAHTLQSVDNNKTEAAKILGFSRKTLHNKLDKYENEASTEV